MTKLENKPFKYIRVILVHKNDDLLITIKRISL